MGKRLKYENVKNLIESDGEYILISKNYKNCKEKLEIKHNKCGNIFFMNVDGFKYRQNRCPICSREKDIERNKNRKLTNLEFKERAIKILGNNYIILEEYNTCHDKIKIKHKTCGNTYYVLPRHILYDNNKCPFCHPKISNGEKFILDLLKNKNINYIHQYYDNDLNLNRNNKLSFDFAILNENNELCGLIEYDGEFHYKPYKNEEKYIKKFKKQLKNDSIKNNFCKDENIPLLRINYKMNKNTRKSKLYEFLDEIL